MHFAHRQEKMAAVHTRRLTLSSGGSTLVYALRWLLMSNIRFLMRITRITVGIVFVLLLISATLLVLGKRVLVFETKVSPGERYVVPVYGNLGEAQQPSLVCRYFTGRSILISVFWYSSENILGKDQCPFITSEG